MTKDKIIFSSSIPRGWLWKRIQESLQEPIEGQRNEIPTWSLNGLAKWDDISDDLEKVRILKESKNDR